MTLINTIKNGFKSRLFPVFILAGMFLFLTSCGSESFTQQEQLKQKGEQTLTFTEKENGTEVHYEVNFNDGEISSVYKDNVKITDKEIKDYEDLVYDKLNSIRRDEDDSYVHHKPYFYHFDMDNFKENMDRMKEEFKGEHFNFKFDHEKFKEDMERLKEEMKEIDEIVIEIDKDKIKKDLDESIKQLDELKIHKFNFDFDEDEFNKNMKRITIELKKNQDELDLNVEELEKEMENLEGEMSDLSKEMEDLDKEMEILNKFLDAVKSELVKDGLIGNTKEEFGLELTSLEMKVNGEKVSDKLHSKYKEIYKEYYNKELDDKIKIIK
jgi:hypothetical protein